VARATRDVLNGFAGEAGEEEVTWLTGEKLAAVRPCLSAGDAAVERSLIMLSETVEMAGQHFGIDQVWVLLAFV